MRTPNTKCEICGKPLYRRPAEFEKAKYFCCKGCRSKLHKKHSHLDTSGLDKGRAWNKGMSLKNGDKLDYAKPRTEETKKNISEALKAKPKKGELRKCPICLKEYYVFPSVIKRKKGRFCSKRCATIYKNSNQKTEGTDIEIILEQWLIDNKIEYEKQKPIKDITVPDFFIESNICLYADGDFWHSKPKVKKRDNWIDRQLKKKGYIVIRLLGSDIKKGVRPDESLFHEARK